MRLFANLRDYLPPGSDRFSCEIETNDGIRVEDILNHLKIPDDLPKIILLNGINSNREESLKEGDVISIFPPIAGG
ncbi:MAG: MoaD/ThiS family protein [Deltaproteobacteria bacterium]|nr:MoaD/ThiS family protein [Deltaproteobacteria bacterium]MBW2308163.1 MoaD/ThiS family protein [Deltaproteobacteria bacterium]